MTVLRELVVATGKWTDKSGVERTMWRTIGHLHEGTKGKYITLDRTFNLAGVPLKEGDDRVYVNLFKPKEQGSDKSAPARADESLNDDIPF